MNSNKHQFTLRLNIDLDKRIEELSQNMGVSKNAFILMILDKEVRKAG